jgi:HSP20 family protein
MSLVRYNPWSLLDQLNRELSNPLSTVDRNDDANVATASWAPSVDITENEEAFVLHADIPGVKPEDIEVSMDNGVLTIKGERKTEDKTEKENFRRVERQYGMFYRRFTLPDTANAEKIEAHSEHGVLKVTIPKQAVAQARRITVNH